MKICFATNNKNKLKEIKKSLGDSHELLSLKDINCLEELPETQETIEGNSLQKAQYVFDNYGVACFADDTGLEINALSGEPGVYSARYAGPDCKAEDNMAKVLNNLSGISDRAARFKTVITLIDNGGNKTQFEGIANGEITRTKSGADGFGYDPIFKPEGYDLTFAEISIEEKNRISHRGKAVRKLLDFLIG